MAGHAVECLFTIAQATNVAGIAITNKSCLIMDEVDGMSAGDRGGVGALAALIRKTKVSWVFLVCHSITECDGRFQSYALPTTPVHRK